MLRIETILIGVGLSMDALAAALALGAAEGSRFSGKKILLTALFFGGFQALMPIAGWFGGGLAGAAVQRYGQYIAAVLLWLIGGKMILDREQEKPLHFDLRKLLMLAVATSIDALLVGVGFACLGRNSILPDALLIGLTTALLSAAGGIAGRHTGKLLGKHCSAAGGLILIGIGIKTLIFG